MDFDESSGDTRNWLIHIGSDLDHHLDPGIF